MPAAPQEWFEAVAMALGLGTLCWAAFMQLVVPLFKDLEQ